MLSLAFNVLEFKYFIIYIYTRWSCFYVKDTLAYKLRNDLLLNPLNPGDFESNFIEIIIPDKKNLILGFM